MDYQNTFKPGVLSVAEMYSAFQGAFTELAQNYMSTTEPNPTFACQLWADTTTGLLKLRNADNTAWVTICKLSGFTIVDGSLAIEI